MKMIMRAAVIGMLSLCLCVLVVFPSTLPRTPDPEDLKSDVETDVNYTDHIGNMFSLYEYMVAMLGNKKPNCHVQEVVKFDEKCESFNETNCFTQNKEVCRVERIKNCTSVIETKTERTCFNVTELMCNLQEHVHYQSLREYYQVQRCFTAKDRVCDTVYAMEHRREDEFQCVELDSPNCHMEELILYDITCTDSVEFDCKSFNPDSAVNITEEKLSEIPRHVCERTPTKQCYDVPRQVQMEKCESIMYKYCDKFTNTIPEPYQEQNCHFEEKKICEIQDRMRVKKGKKYSYSTDCDKVPRELCDQTEKKVLEPVCFQEKRLVCSYVPEQHCQTDVKEYCYKYEMNVLEEVCEDKVETSYL